MSRNLLLPCTIELQPLSLTRLKMRKVELWWYLFSIGVRLEIKVDLIYAGAELPKAT